jgi:hypothetical protein
MIDSIPILHKFSRLYWGQMGDEVYGTLEKAFLQMLEDASLLPDRGNKFKQDLYGELMLIADNPSYEQWVIDNFSNPVEIRNVAGRFIMPSEVKVLRKLLESRIELR